MHCEGVATDKIANIIGTDGGSVRLVIRRIKAKVTEQAGPQSFEGPSVEVVKTSRYVITCAQNATKAHPGFLAALRRYCEANDAQLLVIPFRYRNPTSKDETPDDWWCASIAADLMGQRREIVPGLVVMGDIKIQPTAVNPLSGLHTITGAACGIFGHTKVAMESVPTPGTRLPKLLYTTGAITIPQYSDSKAGKKGEFHHVLGALVVESGSKFHIRQISAQSNGAFIDLDKKYTPQGIEDAPPPAAFIMGDLHAVRADPANLRACHDIIDTLKPRRLVLHDSLDFQSASHHNDFFERFRLFHQGKSDVMQELRLTCDVIDALADKAKTHIITSNHDEHLYKWLESHQSGLDVQNALIYHQLKAEMLAEIIDKGRCPEPLELAARKMMRNKAQFTRHESLQIHSIECGYHGDKGPNGARGNANGFDRIGVKTVIGHSHTPRIVGGCYQTGTSSVLDMGYNKGPSSWLHSHVLIDGLGKRTHIHVIDGEWKI
jgi:hypothetical protein